MRAKKHTSYKRLRGKKKPQHVVQTRYYKRESCRQDCPRNVTRNKAVMSHFCQKVEPDLHQSGSTSPYNESEIYTCTSLFLFT